MAVRIRQKLEVLLQDLEQGGFKVHSVELLTGAPGRDIDIHLQNSVVLKWDVTTKSIWAEGPSRAARKIERFLYAVCEGSWFERTEAIQRRRLTIYLRKTSREASAKFSAQRKIISAQVAVQSRIIAAKTAAKSRIIGAQVAAQTRVISAQVAAHSRQIGGKMAVAAERHGRELAVTLVQKSARVRNQWGTFIAVRAPRLARYFTPATTAVVQPAALPSPASDTRPSS
jgi:hypothetical protein